MKYRAAAIINAAIIAGIIQFVLKLIWKSVRKMMI